MYEIDDIYSVASEVNRRFQVDFKDLKETTDIIKNDVIAPKIAEIDDVVSNAKTMIEDVLLEERNIDQ